MLVVVSKVRGTIGSPAPKNAGRAAERPPVRRPPLDPVDWLISVSREAVLESLLPRLLRYLYKRSMQSGMTTAATAIGMKMAAARPGEQERPEHLFCGTAAGVSFGETVTMVGRGDDVDEVRELEARPPVVEDTFREAVAEVVTEAVAEVISGATPAAVPLAWPRELKVVEVEEAEGDGAGPVDSFDTPVALETGDVSVNVDGGVDEALALESSAEVFGTTLEGCDVVCGTNVDGVTVYDLRPEGPYEGILCRPA